MMVPATRAIRWHARTACAGRVALLVAALGACADGTSAPLDTRTTRVDAELGNAQIATASSELSAPLTVRVTSARGTPITGVRVTWQTADGGSIVPADSETDEAGEAEATWTLGPGSGRQSVAVQAAGSAAGFWATAAAPLALGETRPMLFTTFDGSGEVVHPDVARVPRGFAAARRFLAITPYPGGNQWLEDPSVFASGDPATWEPPAGLTNPVARPGNGYLSDPDIVYNPERGELWLYYRHVDAENTIFVRRSSDGTHWSERAAVAHAPNQMLISPSVVRVSSAEWHMWSVNAGSDGCRAATTVVEHRISSDGLSWSQPEPVDMGNPQLSPWHVDVEWIPAFQEFWALYNGKRDGDCATPALFLATSRDGTQWESYPAPVVERGEIPQLNDIVYRASLEYDARTDMVTLWLSGARYLSETYIWSAVVRRLERGALFATAQRTLPALRRAESYSSAPKLFSAP